VFKAMCARSRAQGRLWRADNRPDTAQSVCPRARPAHARIATQSTVSSTPANGLRVAHFLKFIRTCPDIAFNATQKAA
jgi:hypothetical protein